MAQRMKRWFWLPCALMLGVVLLSNHAFAQGSSGKAIPAILESQKSANAVDGAGNFDVPTDRLIIVFLVIGGLIYLTYFGLRRYVSWSRDSRAKKRSVGVIDSIPLGGKRCVTVTRVYDRILVLGVGEDSITLLTEINEEGMEKPAAPGKASKAAEPFLNLLSNLTRKRQPVEKIATAPVPAVTTAGEGSLL